MSEQASYLLHLDTATKVCSVALSKAGELKQVIETGDDAFSHGENLTLFIEDLFKKEGITMNELAGVSVASGPGSYTGLRIGVSTAKGLCYALGIPLLALDALRCLEQVARNQFPDRVIIPMIDARRMEVFTAIYDESGQEINPAHPLILEQGLFKEYPTAVFCGDGSLKMEAFKLDGQLIASEIKASASAQAAMIWEKFRQNKTEDLAYFQPFYLKEYQFGK